MKVRTGSEPACAISATTIEESIPPERSAPSGTSAASRRRTAAPTVSRTRSSHSASVALGGAGSGCHQRSTRSVPFAATST